MLNPNTPSSESLRSRADVQKDIDSSAKTFSKNLDQAHDLLENLPDDQRTLINNILENITGNTQNPDEIAKSLFNLRQNRSDLDPSVQKFLEAAIPYFHSEGKLTGYQKELIPFLQQDLRELAPTLLAQVNYDAILEYYYRKPDKDEIGTLRTEISSTFLVKAICDRISDKQFETWDYNRLSYLTDLLTQFKERWTEKGMTKPLSTQTDNLDSRNQETILASLNEKLGSLLSELSEYNNLTATYILGRVFRAPFDPSLSSIQRILSVESIKSYWDFDKPDIVKGSDLDPRLLMSIDKFIEQKRLEHESAGHLSMTPKATEAHIQAALQLDRDKIIEKINVSGLENPEHNDVVTQSEIKNRLTLFPSHFIAGITSLDFTHGPGPQEEPDKPGIITETVGRYYPEFDENFKLTSAKIENYWGLIASEPQLAKYRKRELLATQDHEIGHNTHFRFTFDEMKLWEDVIGNDRVNITWYIKHSYDKDESAGKREDFADSFEMFINHPFLLSVLSEGRYNFMKGHFLKYYTSEQQLLFQARHDQQLKDEQMYFSTLSRDKIRELYLYP